ncbi:MAG: glutamate synthase [Planctomycetes bacterium]|nr:glutamate synthase [Planctomycetota bacterium]
MAVLCPASFADLVTRLHAEPAQQDALFELPRRHWHIPAADALDLSVDFHGHRAGNPVGPAAGPHTQMAQNILLSYVAGARILELKTVQVNDRLTIARPCIDMTNVGYNVEWSQELTLAESAREYAAGAMLIEMFRRSESLTGGALAGPAGDWLLDLSVGYNLAGIESAAVRRFLDQMRDATTLIEQLRAEIPMRCSALRDLDHRTCLSTSITLSTFHGCPADEIERICERLLGADFDVVVKMNPPTLGRERLEHLLHDVLGYRELTVNPEAYDAAMSMADSVELGRRLRATATRCGRRIGFKFANTLEVMNHRSFFPSDQRVMYLSGQPLHVIVTELAHLFREAVGPDVPISFSAGIDQHNFPLAVACGFVPVTTCTDLLRPGGYGRLPGYLAALETAMLRLGARTVDEYIVKVTQSQNGATPEVERWSVAECAMRNTAAAAALARQGDRYRAERNRTVPRRVDSHLTTFDCLTCDKCLPVCPNVANFLYPTSVEAFEFHDVVVDPAGGVSEGPARRFEIRETLQIACYADFCNECGNCDTFCPEYGGPYIKKPSFFGSERSWREAAPRDGFFVDQPAVGRRRIRGRIKGVEYELVCGAGLADEFDDGAVRLAVIPDRRVAQSVLRRNHSDGAHSVDVWVYHVMRHLLDGVLSPQRVNQINSAWTNQT